MSLHHKQINHLRAQVRAHRKQTDDKLAKYSDRVRNACAAQVLVNNIGNATSVDSKLLDKRKAGLEKAQKEQVNAEEAYRQQVAATVSLEEKLEEYISLACVAYEDLERRRLQWYSDAVKVVTTSFRTVSGQQADIASKLEAAVSVMDSDAHISAIVAKYKTGPCRPYHTLYQPQTEQDKVKDLAHQFQTPKEAVEQLQLRVQAEQTVLKEVKQVQLYSKSGEEDVRQCEDRLRVYRAELKKARETIKAGENAAGGDSTGSSFGLIHDEATGKFKDIITNRFYEYNKEKSVYVDEKGSTFGHDDEELGIVTFEGWLDEAVVGSYTALFDFNPEEADELALTKGDEVEVTGAEFTGWVRGYLSGKETKRHGEGIIPLAYLTQDE